MLFFTLAKSWRRCRAFQKASANNLYPTITLLVYLVFGFLRMVEDWKSIRTERHLSIAREIRVICIFCFLFSFIISILLFWATGCFLCVYYFNLVLLWFCICWDWIQNTKYFFASLTPWLNLTIPTVDWVNWDSWCVNFSYTMIFICLCELKYSIKDKTCASNNYYLYCSAVPLQW